MEDDGETYTTVSNEEEVGLALVDFGAVRFWDQEVTTELSDIISASVNLED